MLSRVRSAPKLDQVCESSLDLDPAINGDWTVTDLIEQRIDEVSTAVSVGSGLSSPLGQELDDDALERLVNQFLEQRWDSVKSFLNAVAPGMPRSMRRRFRELLRDVG
jgi:hypothetical protein